MMKATGLKYIFLICSALLLAVMLILSKNAGISCDEVLHYKQSVAVRDFFLHTVKISLHLKRQLHI